MKYSQEKTIEALKKVGQVMFWFFVVTWAFTLAAYVWQNLGGV
jgi:hypothetical protein